MIAKTKNSRLMCKIINSTHRINLTKFISQSLFEKCKNVKSLSLLGSPNVTDESIKKLASNKKLQKIKIESKWKYFILWVKILRNSFATMDQHLFIWYSNTMWHSTVSIVTKNSCPGGRLPVYIKANVLKVYFLRKCISLNS